jgi:hypothetical protein
MDLVFTCLKDGITWNFYLLYSSDFRKPVLDSLAGVHLGQPPEIGASQSERRDNPSICPKTLIFLSIWK